MAVVRRAVYKHYVTCWGLLYAFTALSAVRPCWRVLRRCLPRSNWPTLHVPVKSTGLGDENSILSSYPRMVNCLRVSWPFELLY